MVKRIEFRKGKSKPKWTASTYNIIFSLTTGTNELGGKYWTQGHCRCIISNIPESASKKEYLAYSGESLEEVKKKVRQEWPKIDTEKLLFVTSAASLLVPFLKPDAGKAGKNTEPKNPLDVPHVYVYSTTGKNQFCFATGARCLPKKATFDIKVVPVAELTGKLYAISFKNNVRITYGLDKIKNGFLFLQDYVLVQGYNKAQKLMDVLKGSDDEEVYYQNNTTHETVRMSRKEFRDWFLGSPVLLPTYSIGLGRELDNVAEAAPEMPSFPPSDQGKTAEGTSLPKMPDVGGSYFLSLFDREADDTVYIYTDGSAMQDKVFCAWAYAVYQNGKEIFCKKNVHPVRDHARRAVHMAEFLAVLHALDYVIENKPRNAVICYDNDSVFNIAFAKTASDIDLFCKYAEYVRDKWALLESMGINISMKHVKAHTGVTGNERADSLAKSAMADMEEYF